MIKTFEEHTAKLNEAEMKALPYIVKSFNNRVGCDKIISGSEICTLLNVFFSGEENPVKFTGPRIRKFVHHIVINRMTDMPLIANSKGYYITNNIEEINNHLESLLDRMDAIKVRYESVKNWR